MSSLLKLDVLEKYNLPQEDKIVERARAIENLNSGKVVVIGFSGKKGAGKDTFSDRFKSLLEEHDGLEVQVSPYAAALKGEATIIMTQVDALFAQSRQWWHTLFPSKTVKQSITRKLAELNNLTPEQAEKIIEILQPSNRWNKPVFSGQLNGWSRSPQVRALLQFLGTEVRQSQDQLYWVRRTVQNIIVNASNGVSTIVPDTRFLHEAQAIHDLGGYLIRVDIDPEVQEQRMAMRDMSKNFAEAQNHRSELELDDYQGFDVRIDNTSIPIADNLATLYSGWKEQYDRLHQHHN